MPVQITGTKFYAWDSDTGEPLAFGKVYTYLAGTNTPKTTFTSESGETANANPVILNGAGYADIYLDGSYKIVVKDADDVEVHTTDPVSDPSQLQQEWIKQLSVTQIDPETFSVPGNKTDVFPAGVGVRVKQDSGFVYGEVVSAVYAADKTTVTLTMVGDDALSGTADYSEVTLITKETMRALLPTSKFPYVVPTISDLQNLSSELLVDGARFTVTEYYTGTGLGGGEFYFDSARTAENNGFSVIDGFVRIISGQIIYPEMAGARGNGSNDDGPALRACVDYLENSGGGGLILVSKRAYACSVADLGGFRPSIIRPLKGIHVNLNGSTLQTNDTVTAFDYNCVDLTDSDNCSVTNGVVKGNKYNPSASGGEWGMGLGMYGTRNFECRNLRIIEQGGDGIYIGTIGSLLTYCENIKMENIVCDDNRRQGISVISIKNLEANNIICSNTSGTAPADGIDFEPNNSGEFLENVIFNNTKTFGNDGEGVKFFLPHIDNTSARISVTFHNFKSSGGDGTGVRCRNGNAIGSIRFTGVTELINTRGPGLSYEDFESTSVTFDKLVTSLDGTQTGEAAVMIGAGNATTTRGCEKLKIKDLEIYGTYDRGLLMRGPNMPFIRDIEIDVSHIDPAVEGEGEIGLAEAFTGRIRVTANSEDFSKTYTSGSSVLTSYSQFRHPITQFIGVSTTDGYNISGMRQGVSVTCVNDLSAGSTAKVSNGSSPGSRFFSPGGAVGSYVNLLDRGSWIKVERTLEDQLEYRILEGVGYEVIDPV